MTFQKGESAFQGEFGVVGGKGTAVELQTRVKLSVAGKVTSE